MSVERVTTPADPDARIQAIPIDVAELRARLGDGFVPGMEVNCDHCLKGCKGMIRHPDLPHG